MANEDSFSNIAPAAVDNKKKEEGKNAHSKSQKDIDNVELNEDSFQKKIAPSSTQAAKSADAAAGSQAKK